MRGLAAIGCIGVVAVTLTAEISARADGAIAVGRCDRFGYTYGFVSMAAARATALANCSANGDRRCRVALTLSGACGAFAVSGICGARGWALAPTRGQAEGLALNYCARYGGHHCRLRLWVCDGG